MVWSTIVRDLRRAGISRRLVVYIIMCSSAIALIATAIQLYFDYASDVRLLDQRLGQIEASFGESIADALWNLDHDQVQVVIEGILRLPDIEYVRVSPSDLDSTITAGSQESQYTKSTHFTLTHVDDGESHVVGEIHVVASLFGILTRLKQKFFVVLITQGIKTFLVAAFMFLIFNALIIQHLDRIAGFARNIRLGSETPKELVLTRPKRQGADEIDDVVEAINQMQSELFDAYRELIASNTALDERTHELARHKENLERLVDDRTEKLKVAHQAMLAQAHQSGMAEIATGVLHNVGNALNSLNISSQLMLEGLASSSINKLERTKALLQDEQEPGLSEKEFKLHTYLIALCDRLVEERDHLRREVQRMEEQIQVIRSAVNDQQTYAEYSGFQEQVDLRRLIGDVLRLEASSFRDAGIDLKQELERVPNLMLPKSKVSYALLHVLKNARESVMARDPQDRQVRVRLSLNEDEVTCSVTDNGTGLSASSRKKLFEFGFSTKGSGRGFGLHTCALAMRDCGGRVEVESGGPNKGATFKLVFPREANHHPDDGQDQAPA